MDLLFPIVRRVRRPLVPVEDVKPVAPLPVQAGAEKASGEQTAPITPASESDDATPQITSAE